MKKAFVLGMVVLSMTAAQTSFAAGAAKAPREMLAEYSKTIKEHMFGKGGSAKSLSEADASKARQALVKELDIKLSAGQQASLKSALTGEAGKARMESLATIVAAKKLSENLSKVDQAEAASIDKASDAYINMLANATLVGAVKDSSIKMQPAELSLVRESLTKLENLSGEVIVNFSKAERDSYTQVMNKLSELTDSGSTKSYEENFITAIMEVKKVDRTKALEIVKKLKECV